MSPSQSGPLIHLTIANITGILLGFHFDVSNTVIVCLLFAHSASYFIIMMIKKPQSNLLLWLLALLIFGTIGTYRTQSVLKDQQDFGGHSDKESYRILTVTSQPILKNGHQRFEAEATQIKKGQEWLNITEKTLITSPSNQSLNYGDKLIAFYKPSRITNLGNPNEFDFVKFSALDGIYFQTYLNSSNISKLNKVEKHSLKGYSLELRAFWQKELKQHIPHNQNFAVINAMVFGDKSLLDHELKSNYAATGAMHILAVSGLHVGVLFLILQFLTRRLPKSTRWRLVTLIITLAVLWVFALLTGLSSSVVRSALMFSIFQIGKTWQRQYQPMNALAFAALIMLLIDPNELLRVGFQLSFIAVGGIVILYPKFYNLWTAPKYMDYFWQIICVSLAAQLVTTPIALFYFHQFPTYFLLTNIIIIPIAFCIVSMGVIFMALYWIPLLSYLIGKTLDLMASILNKAIEYINDLKFSSITPINLTITEVLLIYTALLFTYLFILKKKKPTLYTGITTIAILIIMLGHDQIKRSNNLELVIYNTPKHHTTSISEGSKFFISTDHDNTPYQALPHIQALGYNPKNMDNLRINIIDLGTNKVLFWNKHTIAITEEIDKLPKAHYDIIVVSKQGLKKETSLTHADYDHLIFDSTNPKWYCEKWSKKLNADKTWRVSKQGAFRFPINSTL